MHHKNSFIKFLVGEIMRKSNTTYARALAEITAFEKSPEFKKSYYQWDEMQRNKKKSFYIGPRHVTDSIKRLLK